MRRKTKGETEVDWEWKMRWFVSVGWTSRGTPTGIHHWKQILLQCFLSFLCVCEWIRREGCKYTWCILSCLKYGAELGGKCFLVKIPQLVNRSLTSSKNLSLSGPVCRSIFNPFVKDIVWQKQRWRVTCTEKYIFLHLYTSILSFLGKLFRNCSVTKKFCSSPWPAGAHYPICTNTGLIAIPTDVTLRNVALYVSLWWRNFSKLTSRHGDYIVAQ